MTSLTTAGGLCSPSRRRSSRRSAHVRDLGAGRSDDRARLHRRPAAGADRGLSHGAAPPAQEPRHRRLSQRCAGAHSVPSPLDHASAARHLAGRRSAGVALLGSAPAPILPLPRRVVSGGPLLSRLHRADQPGAQGIDVPGGPRGQRPRERPSRSRAARSRWTRCRRHTDAAPDAGRCTSARPCRWWTS